jgi:hypothetical protein
MCLQRYDALNDYPAMNCPFCKQVIPENHASSICPHCGHDLPSINPGPTTELPPFKVNWLWFWLALIAPPILTALSAASTKHTSNDGLPVAVSLLGGGIGGIVCGVVIGIKLGKTTTSRVVLSLIFSGIMVVVSIMLCFFGCTMGGYQLDLK